MRNLFGLLIFLFVQIAHSQNLVKGIQFGLGGGLNINYPDPFDKTEDILPSGVNRKIEIGTTFNLKIGMMFSEMIGLDTGVEFSFRPYVIQMDSLSFPNTVIEPLRFEVYANSWTVPFLLRIRRDKFQRFTVGLIINRIRSEILEIDSRWRPEYSGTDDFTNFVSKSPVKTDPQIIPELQLGYYVTLNDGANLHEIGIAMRYGLTKVDPLSVNVGFRNETLFNLYGYTISPKLLTLEATYTIYPKWTILGSFRD